MFCTLLLWVGSGALPAQTLARPGWAGSGLSAEVWWRNAVFYRIAPATFQDSDGDGKGDLGGIVQRLVYLQSLSVDAIVLEAPFDDNGFDDLIGEASRHHIRLLVTVEATGKNEAAIHARRWLARGCAGVWLRVPPKADGTQTAETVRTLRSLTDSYPGQRVLVEDTSADPAVLPAPGAQLVTRALVAGIGDHTDALSLRVQLAQMNSVPQGSAPVLLLHRGGKQILEDAKQSGALGKILASALFFSRAATAIDAGQEIDLSTSEDIGRVMQWTPTNVTREVPVAIAAAAVTPQPPRREDEYGPFVPYAERKKPAPLTGPDFEALPGFSSVAVERPAGASPDSVAGEDAAPSSLLNFYRRLSQLHHEHAAQRTGAYILLNRDSDGVLAWALKPSTNTRTSSMLLVASNLTDSPKTLSYGPDIATPGIRTDDLQPLLSSSPFNSQVVQRVTSVRLAAWSVVVLSLRR